MRAYRTAALTACIAMLAGATPSLAAPPAVTAVADTGIAPLAEPVHGYHCDPRWSRRDGWHRHWGACLKLFPKYHREHEHWRHDRWRHKQHGAPRWL